jgi:hypothetical protein
MAQRSPLDSLDNQNWSAYMLFMVSPQIKNVNNCFSPAVEFFCKHQSQNNQDDLTFPGGLKISNLLDT